MDVLFDYCLNSCRCLNPELPPMCGFGSLGRKFQIRHIFVIATLFPWIILIWLLTVVFPETNFYILCLLYNAGIDNGTVLEYLRRRDLLSALRHTTQKLENLRIRFRFSYATRVEVRQTVLYSSTIAF